MTLLLTSAALKNDSINEEFVGLLNRPADQVKIIMLTFKWNDEQRYYVNLSIDELINVGILRENITIFDLSLDKFDVNLLEFDVLYMAGGNTFHIMDKIRKLGLIEKIKEFVNRGKLYLGVSAGSILAGPNIDIASPWDANDIDLTELEGFNFVDFAVSPHFTPEELKIIRKRQKQLNIPVRPLTDMQAFLVKDGEVTLVGKGSEVII